MTDLDVSLRLRLENQLSRPAETAERDLKELQRTVEKLGKTKGGDGLAQDLKDASRSANKASSEIDDMRRKLGNVETQGDQAKRAITGIAEEARQAKAAIGQMDNNAFAGLKADAKQAEDAIDRVGRAAHKVQTNAPRGLSAPAATPHTLPHGQGPMSRPPGRLSTAAGAAYEALGMDGLVVLGSGAAYAVGSGVAAGAVVAGATVKSAADAEFGSDQLAVTGGYDEKQQAAIDRQLRTIGAKRGVGEIGAQGVYGNFLAGGIDKNRAIASTDRAIVLAKAANADPQDVAAMTIAMMDNMGITGDKMDQAYDAAFFGANAGKFEMKDMAGNLPILLAGASANKSKGLEGLKFIIAASQSVVKSSGSPDQATTNMKGLFSDLLAPGVMKDLKDEFGINVSRIKAKAEKKGEDPLLAVLDVINKKVGPDAEKLGKAFRNQEGATALMAILNELPAIKKMMEDMGNSKGSVEKGYDRATGNVNSQYDRLSSHVAKTAKSLAEPILPYLEKALRYANEQIEKDHWTNIVEKGEKEDDEAAAGRRKSVTDWVKKTGSGIDWNSFLFGEAADPNFDLKKHFAIDLRPSGENSMQSMAEGIQAQRETVAAAAQGIAEQLRSILGITITPTIQPTFVPPAGAPAAPGKQSALTPGGNLKVTQNISSPNARGAARHAQREQNRAIRHAQAGSFADTGRLPT